jgi:fructose-bisphosphate aldolase class II
MNIDTDLQWAFWDGVRLYDQKYHGYLQGQIGNPEGDDQPNKKYYDPRRWLRSGEDAFRARLKQAFADLNNVPPTGPLRRPEAGNHVTTQRDIEVKA